MTPARPVPGNPAPLATIPVGTRLNAGARLAAVVLVLVVMLLVDR
ncbi:hypothetical protein ACGFIY_32760 [Micromonospora chersina]